MNIKQAIGLTVFVLVSIFAKAQVAREAVLKAMQPYLDSSNLAGYYYLVANGDKILEQGGAGYADIENNKKMDGDKLFWIASQSKPFAGVAVMMLVEEGKLDLDKPVSEYLPGFDKLLVNRINRDSIVVLERINKPVTLRRLLSHSSGMEFLPGFQQKIGLLDVVPLSTRIYLANMTPLASQPGDSLLYSNQGINIAAAIVERVAQIPYEDFLRTRIFEPLGMKSITFWPSEKQLKDMVVPYKKEAGHLMPVTFGSFQYPLTDHSKRFAEAAGGLFCTPNDLVKFYQMIANNGIYQGKRLLSETAVRELSKRQTPDKLNPWGLGWAIGPNFMGHGGAMGTQSRLYLKEKLIAMYFVLGERLPTEREAYRSFEQAVKKVYDIK